MKARLGKVDVLKEIPAVIAYVIGVACIAFNYSSLPSQVPIHYGLFGVPDAWAPKPMVWLYPAIATFLFASLTLGQYFGKPNLAWTTTRKNRARIYRLTRNLIWWLKTILMWMLAYVLYMEVQIAHHRVIGLGHYFAPSLASMPFLTLSAYFYIAHRIAQQK